MLSDRTERSDAPRIAPRADVRLGWAPSALTRPVFTER
jgi:hypothetical protein